MPPPNLDALAEQITRHAESRNRDYLPSGAPVRSPVGALYAMQTMPATAGDPGYGVTPASGNNPAEYNRVGREYLAAMMQRYGDPTAAWAAYNWGPGRVDRAKAKFGSNWFAHAPASVRSYARGNAQAYARQTSPESTVKSVMDEDEEPTGPLNMAASGATGDTSGWATQMQDVLSQSSQAEQDAAAQRKALYEGGLAALQEQYAVPGRSELFGRLGQALLAPRSMPGFGGTLQNVAAGLGDFQTQQREAQMARARALAQLTQQYGSDSIADRREGIRDRISALKAMKPTSGDPYKGATWDSARGVWVPRPGTQAPPIPVATKVVGGQTRTIYSDGSFSVVTPSGAKAHYDSQGHRIDGR